MPLDVRTLVSCLQCVRLSRISRTIHSEKLNTKIVECGKIATPLRASELNSALCT